MFFCIAFLVSPINLFFFLPRLLIDKIKIFFQFFLKLTKKNAFYINIIVFLCNYNFNLKYSRVLYESNPSFFFFLKKSEQKNCINIQNAILLK